MRNFKEMIYEIFCIIFCMVIPGQFIYIMLHMIILEQFQIISKTTTSFSFSSLATSFFSLLIIYFLLTFLIINYLTPFPTKMNMKRQINMYLFISMIFILIQIKFDNDINNDELLETERGKT